MVFDGHLAPLAPFEHFPVRQIRKCRYVGYTKRIAGDS